MVFPFISLVQVLWFERLFQIEVGKNKFLMINGWASNELFDFRQSSFHL